MGKLSYWLKKSGMLRTSSYAVKGDAQKLNEIEATDGGMVQSQQEIDEEQEKKTEEEK